MSVDFDNPVTTMSMTPPRSLEDILAEYRDRQTQLARLQAELAETTDPDMQKFLQDQINIETNILADITTTALAAGATQADLDQITNEAEEAAENDIFDPKEGNGDTSAHGQSRFAQASGGNEITQLSTSSSGQRELTDREKQLLEYMYQAIFTPESMPDIYAAVSAVRIYDANESWNPFVLAAMGRGMGAITLGSNQHYNTYPAPNDINRLPILAHETIHSIDAYHIGLPAFLVQYSGASAAYFIETGNGYRGIETEVTAYAVEETVRTFLKDSVFRSAVQSGTIAHLPKNYPERIFEEFQKQRELIEAKFRRSWMATPLGVP